MRALHTDRGEKDALPPITQLRAIHLGGAGRRARRRARRRGRRRRGRRGDRDRRKIRTEGGT